MVKNLKSAKKQFKNSPNIKRIFKSTRAKKDSKFQIDLKSQTKRLKQLKKQIKTSKKNVKIVKLPYENIKTFPNLHSSTLIYMKRMNNKKYFLTASDYHLIIYSIETMKKIATITNYFNSWTHCLELANGEIICINSNNVTFYKFDNITQNIIEIKNLFYQIPKFSKGLYQIDGRTIAVCKEKEVYFLDTHNYNVKNTILLNYDCKSSLIIENKQKILMMSENKIEIIDLLLKDNISKIHDCGSGIKQGFDIENNKFVIYNFSSIKIYDSNNFKKLHSVNVKDNITIVKKINFKNNLIGVGDINGKLQLFDYECKLIYSITISKIGINCLFSLNDNKILFNLDGNRIVLFDVEKKKSIFVKRLECANSFRKGFLLDDGTFIMGYCKSFVVMN